MPQVEVDEETYRHLEFAAQIADINVGEVVKRLVALRQMSSVAEPVDAEPTTVPIHADYDGYRTRARFTPGPGRVEIIGGPLAGSVYRTPSEAARAVVSAQRPDVNPQRNGWTFWIESATGAPIQGIRHLRR
jgi:hypothetical protein